MGHAPVVCSRATLVDGRVRAHGSACDLVYLYCTGGWRAGPHEAMACTHRPWLWHLVAALLRADGGFGVRGVCTTCGAPMARIVEETGVTEICVFIRSHGSCPVRGLRCISGNNLGHTAWKAPCSRCGFCFVRMNGMVGYSCTGLACWYHFPGARGTFARLVCRCW